MTDASNDRSAVEPAPTPEKPPVLPEEEDMVEGDASPSDVPAGGAGADSGAADTVGVDPATEDAAAREARSYSSTHNDEPGVGNRGGQGDRV